MTSKNPTKAAETTPHWIDPPKKWWWVLAVLISGVWFLWLTVATASAQTPEPSVEVVVINGPLDDRIMQLAIDTINQAVTDQSELVILQLDSTGVVGSASKLKTLAELIKQPPLPLAVWVGPAPARALGGASQLLSLAPLRLAAPETTVGLWRPTRPGRDDPSLTGVLPENLAEDTIRVTGPVPGMVDQLFPSIRQLLQDLDQTEVTFAGQTRRLNTVRNFPNPNLEDGTPTGTEESASLTVLPTRFHHPDPITSVMRLPLQPAVLLFLLVMALTIAVFEFYAIGPGIAAFVSGGLWALAAYGIAILPLNWWPATAVLLILGGLSAAYQYRTRLSYIMLAAVAAGGLGWFIADTSPQITPSIPGVLLSVAAIIFFYWVAMPAVARSRFSATSVGRDFLVGETGSAATPINSEGGSVLLKKGRWQAWSAKELPPNSSVVVSGVVGWVLEVEPERGD